jgi:hypothetical protein
MTPRTGPAYSGPVPTRRTLAPLLVALALGLAACGSSTVDITQAVDGLNDTLLAANVQVTCPETQVEEDATFTCQVESTDGARSIDVEMKVVDENGEPALDVVDAAAFQAALEEASGLAELEGGATTAE